MNCPEFHFSRLERAEAHRHVIPQALALALRGVAPGAVSSINLRKGDFAFTGDVEQIGGGMRNVAIALIAIVLLSLTSFSIHYYSLRGKLEGIESDAKELIRQALPDAPPKALEGTKIGLAVLKSREASLADRMKKLEELRGVSPLEVLKTISEKVPPRTEIKFDVEKLSIAPSRTVLSGYTDSFEAVDRLKQSLEKVKMFRGVTSGNVRKGVKDEVKFDISFELTPAEEEEG